MTLFVIALHLHKERSQPGYCLHVHHLLFAGDPSYVIGRPFLSVSSSVIELTGLMADIY